MNLISLLDYVQSCTLGLIWLNEKQIISIVNSCKKIGFFSGLEEIKFGSCATVLAYNIC